MGRLDHTLHLIREERVRQNVLLAMDRIPIDCTDPAVPDGSKYLVLAEEVGEVARAILEGDTENLRDELVQVAAVAAAWAEGIDQ